MNKNPCTCKETSYQLYLAGFYLSRVAELRTFATCILSRIDCDPLELHSNGSYTKGNIKNIARYSTVEVPATALVVNSEMWANQDLPDHRS